MANAPKFTKTEKTAKLLGVPLDEYIKNIRAGLAYCAEHLDWVKADNMSTVRACKACYNRRFRGRVWKKN